MRISFITPRHTNKKFVNVGMYDALCRQLNNAQDIDIVNSSADIVHIFGLWNWHYAQLVRNISKCGIPVVFTSITGPLTLLNSSGGVTNNLLIRHSVHSILSNASAIHVCGQVECMLLKTIVSGVVPQIIANPDFTHIVSNEKMVSMFVEIYTKVLNLFDTNLKDRIKKQVSEMVQKLFNTASEENDAMVEICSRIIYLHHLLVKKAIPQKFLDEMAALMEKSDYDERAMCQLLKRLHFYRFASFAMTLLHDNSSLTEGYMPISPQKGKLVENMKSYIINN